MKSLPGGVDFSHNKALESLDLEIRSQENGMIKGLGVLQNLKSLSISCSVPSHYDLDGKIKDGTVDSVTKLEALDGLLKKGTCQINISGVRYGANVMEGVVEGSLGLSCVAGLSRVDVSAGKSSLMDVVISQTSLETLEIIGGGDLRVERCIGLKSVTASLMPCSLRVLSCPALVDASFSLSPCSPNEIEFSNLYSLSSLRIDAAEAKIGVNHEGNPQFRLINCGMTHLPEFTGGWRGLIALDLVGNRSLECLNGIEALSDLQSLFVRSVMVKKWNDRSETRTASHDSLKSLFSTSTPASALNHLSLLVIKDAPLESLVGIGMFPNVASVVLSLDRIQSLDGMETLFQLQRADLSGCSMRSLAPLAGLPNLIWLKSSGCDRIKPKLPHTVMEGAELMSELARHVGPDHPIAKNAPSEELTKIVQLIGEGKRSDVNQAASLLAVLSSEERDKILAGVSIDPKTGWIRLPYLTKIKDEEAMGIPQFLILKAIGGAKADALLASVNSIVINDGDGDSIAELRFGSKPEYGKYDTILDEIDSLGSLPDLPNVTSIIVSRVSRFSLAGLGKFPKLNSLFFWNVDSVDGVDLLNKVTGLKRLTLCGVKIDHITELGKHPEMETLLLDTQLKSLDGLENFSSLKDFLITHTCDDITGLLSYASNRRCRVSCSSYMDSRYLENVIIFSFSEEV